MTPLAAYILEQAQRAHEELLSEQEFRPTSIGGSLTPPSFGRRASRTR